MNKTIRIWDGCKVLAVISVDQHGGFTSSGAVGGAGNGDRPEIELDPFAGLIVSQGNPTPVAYNEPEL
jgi:hypothetical protein